MELSSAAAPARSATKNSNQVILAVKILLNGLQTIITA